LEENEFVANLTKNSVPWTKNLLIGAKRTGLGILDFEWENGDPFIYSNWKINHPTIMKKNWIIWEICIMIIKIFLIGPGFICRCLLDFGSKITWEYRIIFLKLILYPFVSRLYFIIIFHYILFKKICINSLYNIQYLGQTISDDST
jgi:hypothetical protein